METIFDHNPTPAELEYIGFDSVTTMAALSFIGDITKEIYIERATAKKATFDIALLLELRGEDASSYWAQIPELYEEYLMEPDDIEEFI